MYHTAYFILNNEYDVEGAVHNPFVQIMESSVSKNAALHCYYSRESSY